MADIPSSSDTNGNFQEGVEQGALEDSLVSPTQLDLDQLNVSANDLPPESPETTSLLNVSSDFLPAESPERKEGYKPTDFRVLVRSEIATKNIYENSVMKFS